jgi:glutamyl-tRNA synthetase
VHILHAFDWPEPVWAHLSVFLSPSGKGKMSKREKAELADEHQSIYLTDLEEMGYLPEAVVNWSALMGWSLDDHTEFFTMEDLIVGFNLDRLNPSPAAINFSKLDHFNGLHIRNLSVPELASRLKPFFETAGYMVEDEKLLRITPIIQERIVTLQDAVEIAGFFFEEEVRPVPEELIGKKLTAEESAQAARRAYEVLATLPEITPETAEMPLRALADEMGLKAGQLFGILRVAVTGQKVSPPLFESMAIVGKKKVLQRIEDAIQALDKMVEAEK